MFVEGVTLYIVVSTHQFKVFIYYKYSNEYEFEETNDLTIQGQYDDINKILSLKWSSTNNPNWIKDEVVLFKYDNSSRKWIEYATLPNDGTILIKDAYSINPLTIGPEGSLE